jgi:hypothetical protein
MHHSTRTQSVSAPIRVRAARDMCQLARLLSREDSGRVEESEMKTTRALLACLVNQPGAGQQVHKVAGREADHLSRWATRAVSMRCTKSEAQRAVSRASVQGATHRSAAVDLLRLRQVEAAHPRPPGDLGRVELRARASELVLRNAERKGETLIARWRAWRMHWRRARGCHRTLTSSSSSDGSGAISRRRRRATCARVGCLRARSKAVAQQLCRCRLRA